MKQPSKLTISFRPESDDGKFTEDVKEYEEIWKTDGEKIISAMTRISGLNFQENHIEAIVYDGISRSGRNTSMPMHFRASYPPEVKNGTLIHELAHRLLFPIVDPAKTNTNLDEKNEDLDSHQVLFLILYDIWTELYGREFADRNVKVENSRKGIYDYEKAWRWALNLGKEKRKEIFERLISK